MHATAIFNLVQFVSPLVFQGIVCVILVILEDK